MTYGIAITESPTNSLVTEIEYELIVWARIETEWGVDYGRPRVEIDRVCVTRMTVWVDSCDHEVTIEAKHRRALETDVLTRHEETIIEKVLEQAMQPREVE